jgi:hypothetical protein
MKNQIKLICCLAALVLTMFSAKATIICMTNVHLVVYGTASTSGWFTNALVKTYDGGCSGGRSYTCNMFVNSCTSTNCDGPEITITGCPDLVCNEQDSIVGTLYWKCDPSDPACDSQDVWHSANVVMPAHHAVVSFHICSTPTALCMLFINCTSTLDTPCDKNQPY